MENGTNINSITFRTTLFMKIVLLKEMSSRKKNMFEKKG